MTARPFSIAIIGAGFSGALLAVHLLRRSRPGDRVYLIERRAGFGRGLAYSTSDHGHLLNVRAGNMSAFHDDPGHFIAWLRQRNNGAEHADTDTFVSRRLYGSYIRSVLGDEIWHGGKGRNLFLVPDEAVAVNEGPDGVTLTVAGGRCYTVDIVVLAAGNMPPDRNRGAYFGDPWDPQATAGIPPRQPVLILGTGLTMFDTVHALLARRHVGKILAFSRRGLLPQVHAAVRPIDIPAQRLPKTTSVLRLTAWVKAAVRHAAIQGNDWRAVIDGLRPHTQDLWRRLPLEERRRFLRHLRPWWDLHRHRAAPEVARQIREVIDRGQLVVAAGRVQRMDIAHNFVRCEIQRRGKDATEEINVARVINCSGPETNYEACREPLIRDMLARGFARPDPLCLGLEVSEQGALLSARGVTSSRLFAVGPVTRGTFWEIVAVPDIRMHCVRLANHLTSVVRDRLPAATQPQPRVAPTSASLPQLPEAGTATRQHKVSNA